MISHAFGLTPFSIVVGGKEARKKSGSAAKDAYAGTLVRMVTYCTGKAKSKKH